MKEIKLFGFQKKLMQETEGKDRIAYFCGMGSGKTYLASESAERYANPKTLVVCQKSKLMDWREHYRIYYPYKADYVLSQSEVKEYINDPDWTVGIISYDTVWRRPQLYKLTGYTLILDESSMIQNDTSKRTKGILKLSPANVILLSGTPVSGKYENLWAQMHMLGWNLSKQMYWANYVKYHTQIFSMTMPVKIVDGYKNVERLKMKLREHGAVFMKTEEAIDLPETVDSYTNVDYPRAWYKDMRKNGYCRIDDDTELVGQLPVTKLLRLRQICSSYNEAKEEALRDILASCNDRFVIFYNFNDELGTIMRACADTQHRYGVVNGEYRQISRVNEPGGVLIVQYSAGAMGLNCQIANRAIFYSPTLSADLFMQAKARIHRIGQKRTCFYTYLICPGTIEEDIYDTLEKREDYTMRLFQKTLDTGD